MLNTYLLEELKRQNEMDPYSHDGCYELMSAIVAEYEKVNDLDVCTYKDFDAIYYSVIIKFNAEKKKDKIRESCLEESRKEYLCDIVDKVWDNACRDKYENRTEKGTCCIGMFGSGFSTFYNKASDADIVRFISVLVEILHMDDEEEMFSAVSKVLDKGIHGIGAGVASEILHGLKPFVFPIINGRTESTKAYAGLGIDLDKPTDEETYISNARKIKSFRDSNLPFKNYRIIDVVAFNVSESFYPSLNEYDPKITAEQYKEMFKNPEITNQSRAQVVYLVYKENGQCTCTHLAEKYGGQANFYNKNASDLGKNIWKHTNCPLHKRADGSTQYWPVLFVGRNTNSDEAGSYVWKLREPLRKAVEELEKEGFFNTEEAEKETMKYDLNTILYGPPGTGKTYSTAAYAVAICDGGSVENLMEDYDATMERYKELKNEGRVAFTTFHQSYGYEDFIEGIKPELDAEGGEVGYTLEDGTFKAFCEKARGTKVQKMDSLKIKDNPRIWGMILGGTGMTKIKRQCFDYGEIRVGFHEIEDNEVEGDFIGDEKSSWNAKHMVYDFIHTMEVGDIVVVEKSNKSIDAIGIVDGDYYYDDHSDDYRRVRRVKWLVKDIDVDMVQYLPKGRKQLARHSLFAFDYVGMEAISKILNEASDNSIIEIEHDTKPYVFIIDEINRGNISKIFGELITLIEETKREGSKEAASAILPYSNKEFSVPSNVYILGTMNTADRSIALMDTALRRRFRFVEMEPNIKVLNKLGLNDISIEGQNINISEMLNVINKRIEYLYDREHKIGHAFFTGLKADHSIEKLASIFEKSVIPLLQEYFYEDYSKIQLVLGDDNKPDKNKFILDKDIEIEKVFNGIPDLDLPEKSYSINNAAFLDINSYKLIGKGI